MTHGEALRRAARAPGVTLLDARVLLQAATGLTQTQLIAADRDPLPDGARMVFERFARRRALGEPVSQIVRAREFYGRVFKVTPDVLTPRPETEMLVDAALTTLPDNGYVLDAGTGSGCVLLSILAERPRAGGIGFDASDAAARVASANARRLGLSERAAIARDRFETFPGGGFDVVVSNPPYIEDGANLPRDVKGYEPALALYGGPDGMDAYRAIAPRLPVWLKPSGSAYLEIGAGQGTAVSAILGEALPTHETRVTRDLAGHERLVSLTPRG